MEPTYTFIPPTCRKVLDGHVLKVSEDMYISDPIFMNNKYLKNKSPLLGAITYHCQMLSGRYNIFYSKEFIPKWGKRYTCFGIIHESKISSIDSEWKSLDADIGIDTGMIMFSTKILQEEEEEMHNVKNVKDLGDESDLEQQHDFIKIPSGIGDGFYPLYGLRDESNNMVGILVDFLCHPMLNEEYLERFDV